MSSVKSQESRLEGLGYCFSQFVLRCKDNKKHSNGQIFHQKYAAVKDPHPMKQDPPPVFQVRRGFICAPFCRSTSPSFDLSTNSGLADYFFLFYDKKNRDFCALIRRKSVTLQR